MKFERAWKTRLQDMEQANLKMRAGVEMQAKSRDLYKQAEKFDSGYYRREEIWAEANQVYCNGRDLIQLGEKMQAKANSNFIVNCARVAKEMGI